MHSVLLRVLGMALVTPLLASTVPSWAQEEGLPTSRLGTYVGPGEWLVEPAFEYLKNRDFEYDPSAFGFPAPGEPFQGRLQSARELVFVGYGLSDRVAVEFEAGAIRASLRKAADDPSGLPQEVTESGLGLVRSRLVWQWLPERGRRPELFSYLEAVLPHDKEKPLTGTADWVVNGALGATRGFRWGTVTARLGFQYDTASASEFDFSEYALEYLKRLSPRTSLYLGYIVIEGDEASLATELHWSPSPRVTLRLGNRLGVVSNALSATSNALDWAPTVGVLFRFGKR